jgi:UDP-3-O-[3-hydroxymyristoyl] glucosamine N-acyltransferase
VGAQFTLGRIAEALGATLEGDPGRIIHGVAPLDSAGPEHVSFLVHPRDARAQAESAAGAVVVGRDVEGLPQALLRVDSPQTALISLLRLFHPEASVAAGIRATAIVAGHNRDVGEDVILVSQVGVSGSGRIGNRAVLAGQVGLGGHVTIGARKVRALEKRVRELESGPHA